MDRRRQLFGEDAPVATASVDESVARLDRAAQRLEQKTKEETAAPGAQVHAAWVLGGLGIIAAIITVIGAIIVHLLPSPPQVTAAEIRALETKIATLESAATGLQQSQNEEIRSQRGRIATLEKELAESQARTAGRVTATVREVSAEPQSFGQLKLLSMDHGVTEGSQNGMRFHYQVQLTGAKDRKCDLNIYFEYAGGQKLQLQSKQGDGPYTATDGQIAVHEVLTPSFTSSQYADVAIFFPYDAFRLPPGKYSLQFTSQLLVNGRLLDSGTGSFTYTKQQ